MRVIILIGLACLPIALYAVTDFDREQIQQRIKPVGEVRVIEDAASKTADSPALEKKEVVQKEPGQAIYEQYCVTCHRDGVAGAPKFRLEADWKPRLANTDINALTAIAIKGLNAMPPKGTCSECSEADLKAAIEYMIPKS